MGFESAAIPERDGRKWYVLSVGWLCQRGMGAFDDCIFAFFAVEMVIKMMALGIFGPKCYLGDTWNRLDFFIVMAGRPLCSLVTLLQILDIKRQLTQGAVSARLSTCHLHMWVCYRKGVCFQQGLLPLVEQRQAGSCLCNVTPELTAGARLTNGRRLTAVRYRHSHPLCPSLPGMLEYSLEGHNASLSAIRTVRVLRPLRAINRVPSKYPPPSIPTPLPPRCPPVSSVPPAHPCEPRESKQHLLAVQTARFTHGVHNAPAVSRGRTEGPQSLIDGPRWSRRDPVACSHAAGPVLVSLAWRERGNIRPRCALMSTAGITYQRQFGTAKGEGLIGRAKHNTSSEALVFLNAQNIRPRGEPCWFEVSKLLPQALVASLERERPRPVSSRSRLGGYRGISFGCLGKAVYALGVLARHVKRARALSAPSLPLSLSELLERLTLFRGSLCHSPVASSVTLPACRVSACPTP
ncbi:hypothetical protein JZ751_015257 [Albula glossodonta]|uniref:Ion transport domain-containing protein n=1 Tax=Albula glossodonta TaxID=121402 RepID=A0A8T2NS54_9TELE|nr:hypothetical protein JZ751_015257 [Albula glossodonta]